RRARTGRAFGAARGRPRAGSPAAWGPSPSLFRALLEVAAEALAHRGEDAVAPFGFAARREAVEQGGGEHRGRHALLDGGLHGPAPLAGVAHATRVFVEL